MEHRISVGVLVLRNDMLLLAHHFVPGKHDFWAPPGGGVEDDETLEVAASRETYEETQIVVEAKHLAYIDELIDDSGRMIKFWFVSNYISGEIDTSANPAEQESIVSAGWFKRDSLPSGHVFPEILRSEFWMHRDEGFEQIRRLPLKTSVFS